ILFASDLRDDDLKRRDRNRPDDPGIIVALLDRGRDGASDAEAVATHDHELALSAFVEVRAVHRLRIFRTELEDVTNFDPAVDLQRSAAARTGVAGEDGREIPILRLGKIAARIC